MNTRFAVKGKTMGLRSKLFGLGAALTMSLTLVVPALAAPQTATQPVSVNVQDNLGTLPSFGVTAAINGGNFGSVSLDAVGDANGVYVVPAANNPILAVGFTNDTKLYRPSTTTVSLSLVGGALFLDNPPTDATVYGASMVNFQIPGRYLNIAGVTNPSQRKWTGATSANCSQYNNGTGDQCAPKADDGKPIYHVGDAQGIYGGCGVPGSASNSDPAPVSNCASTDFGPTGSTTVMILHDGSGTVTSGQLVELGLSIPAGVYPGVYTGTVNVTATTAP